VARDGEQSGRNARRLERSAAAAILLLPIAFVCLRCGLSSEIPFIVQRAEAPWIMAPGEVSARLEQWGELEAPVVRFTRRFGAGDPRGAVRLRLRAYGAARVHLNGEEIGEARRDGSRWREASVVELTGRLRPDDNELRVDVANAHGPALLSLRSEGLPEPLVTGPDWSVRRGEGSSAAARLADDTRVHLLSRRVETPSEALIEKADPLLLLFTLGGLGFLMARRWPGVRDVLLAPALAPVLASLAWLHLYATKTSRIPAAIGFDARHHLYYVEQLAEHGRLPLAAEGWSTFHPPLFYAASALLSALGGGEAALKALPLLAGLGVVWMAWGLARRLEPERPGRVALATLFAAVLPVNLYSAAYFSNETLHAFLAGAALVAAAGLLLAEAGSGWRPLACAALFGLAALTKFTVIVTLPVALAFLAWKLVLVDRVGPGRAVGLLAAFAAVVVLVAGWFYARNWVHYGTPAVANWGRLPGEGRIWWQQPGFHTLGYYAKFGEALLHPYLAGFHSFWDSVYSTFWGDGFIAGRAVPDQRHTFWDYGFMSAGYWLAVPATALLAGGGIGLVRETLGEGPVRRRLALGFLATASWAVSLAFLALTIQLPFFAQAKATYLLMLAGPLALAFAGGFAGVDGWLVGRGWLPARVLLYGWLAAFAGALLLSYSG
jgi:hypothetical protein